ncbi:MAG: hypothetical protein II194_01575 [Bacteroidales bacterium]|nr:hypothetical protein [Bacteroidales bacterium]
MKKIITDLSLSKEYASPEMTVMGIHSEGILCASDKTGTIDDWGEDELLWD